MAIESHVTFDCPCGLEAFVHWRESRDPAPRVCRCCRRLVAAEDCCDHPTEDWDERSCPACARPVTPRFGWSYD